MNIAFFHELHFGGARRVVEEYAKVLGKNNNLDLFYVDCKREDEVEKKFNNNYFYEFKYQKYNGNNFGLKLYKDLVEPLKLFFLHKKIADKINNGGYDFVFVHPSLFTHAPFILRFLKLKNVYFCQEPLRTVYDSTVEIPKNINFIKNQYELLIRKIRKYIDSSNIKNAELVLANCNYSKNNIRKAYGINSHVCYLGVNTKIFKPLKVKKEFDAIFIGEEVYMEGFDTLTEINKLFNNKLKIKIIKPEKNKYISDSELALEYNKSKLLLSLGRNDPFSMLPWESNACKVVPVVVNEAGPKEAIVNGKTGYLINRDIYKFKERIDILLNNPELHNKISKNGYDYVIKNWTWEKSTERLLEIINKNFKWQN